MSFALAVTQPQLGGLGGDFFALVRDPGGSVVFVDGGGYAPSRLTPARLRSLGYTRVPERGPLSVNVPGMVRALHMMWRAMGNLEWSELVDPSARLAREGFPASHELVQAIRKHRDLLASDPGSAETFLRRAPRRAGDIVKFPGLAEALSLIAEDPASMYEGDVGHAVAEYVESRGGLLSYEDLKSYRASTGAPISIEYQGRRVYEMPPNTQGITTLHILMLLEEMRIDRHAPSSAERVKAFLSAYKLAYKVRDLFVGDPRYMKHRPEELLSKRFLETVSSSLLGEAPANVRGDADTTFFAVRGPDGTVVAGIQSVFHPFGSGLTEPRYQVVLNSRASGFTSIEGGVNAPGPRKKPLHTLSAVIVEGPGGDVLALGLSGGHYRPQLHAWLLTNILNYGMDVQEALEFPRVLWTPSSSEVILEEGMEVPADRDLNVVVKPYPSKLGVAAAVEVRSNGVCAGYADVRGDGLPMGLV